MTERTFIILGASLAGAKAAEQLRERGFDGRVVLVGSELERPYERPPLTRTTAAPLGKRFGQAVDLFDQGQS